MKRFILLLLMLVVFSQTAVIAIKDSYTDTEYLCGFIDKDGKILGEIKYDEVKEFGKELAPVRVGGVWGLINRNGDFVVEPKYSDAIASPDGGGVVLEGDYWISVDNSGNVISKSKELPEYFNWEVYAFNSSEEPPAENFIEYERADYCGSGIYFVRENNSLSKYAFFNYDGVQLTDFDFQYPTESPVKFSDGLIPVRKNNSLTGYADKDLNVVIDYQFEYAFSFCDGMAMVIKDKKIGYINTKGELVVDYIWDTPERMYTWGHFYNGFATVAKISKSPTTPSSWAEDEIGKALEIDLIPGHLRGFYQGEIYRNDLTVTLGSSLYSIYDADVEKLAEEYNPDYQRPYFKDYTNDYTYLLNRLDILRGRDDNTLGLNQLITRQEFAAMIYRTINVFSDEYKETADKRALFNDDSEIAEWAKDAVYTLNSLEIFLGTPEGDFLPNDSITREETYVVIYRMYNLLK